MHHTQKRAFYSIGNAGVSREMYISELRALGVQTLADVRDNPTGGRHHDLHRSREFSKALGAASITYVYWGIQLGEDQVNNEDTHSLQLVLRGLLASSRQPICLLGHSGEPVKCHRLKICQLVEEMGAHEASHLTWSDNMHVQKLSHSEVMTNAEKHASFFTTYMRQRMEAKANDLVRHTLPELFWEGRISELPHDGRAYRIHLPFNTEILWYPQWLARADADKLFETLQSLSYDYPEYTFAQATGIDLKIESKRGVVKYCDEFAQRHQQISKTSDVEARKLEPWTRELLEKVEAASETVFNCLWVNEYRDGKVGITWHTDLGHQGLGPNPIIGSLSVGATRNFLLKSKLPAGNKGAARISFPLGHGDLLVMGRNSQTHWLHSVPVEAASEQRYNLTFRFYARDDDMLPVQEALASDSQLQGPASATLEKDLPAGVPEQCSQVVTTNDSQKLEEKAELRGRWRRKQEDCLNSHHVCNHSLDASVRVEIPTTDTSNFKSITTTNDSNSKNTHGLLKIGNRVNSDAAEVAACSEGAAPSSHFLMQERDATRVQAFQNAQTCLVDKASAGNSSEPEGDGSFKVTQSCQGVGDWGFSRARRAPKVCSSTAPVASKAAKSEEVHCDPNGWLHDAEHEVCSHAPALPEEAIVCNRSDVQAQNSAHASSDLVVDHAEVVKSEEVNSDPKGPPPDSEHEVCNHATVFSEVETLDARNYSKRFPKVCWSPGTDPSEAFSSEEVHVDESRLPADSEHEVCDLATSPSEDSILHPGDFPAQGIPNVDSPRGIDASEAFNSEGVLSDPAGRSIDSEHIVCNHAEALTEGASMQSGSDFQVLSSVSVASTLGRDASDLFNSEEGPRNPSGDSVHPEPDGCNHASAHAEETMMHPASHSQTAFDSCQSDVRSEKRRSARPRRADQKSGLDRPIGAGNSRGIHKGKEHPMDGNGPMKSMRSHQAASNSSMNRAPRVWTPSLPSQRATAVPICQNSGMPLGQTTASKANSCRRAESEDGHDPLGAAWKSTSSDDMSPTLEMEQDDSMFTGASRDGQCGSTSWNSTRTVRRVWAPPSHQEIPPGATRRVWAPSIR